MKRFKIKLRHLEQVRPARVWGMEKDGEYLRVQYFNAAGEEVIAEYRRLGWTQAPVAIQWRVCSARATKELRLAGRARPRRTRRSPQEDRPIPDPR